MRSEKEILLESKKFASEIRWKSWWHVATTFVVFAAALTVTLLDIWWPLRLVGSVVLGLVLVRMFVIYHDYQHHSILRGSRFAQVLAMTFGVMGVSPPSLWKRSHDQHHHQNSRLYAGSEGSFPLMTTKMFQESSFWQRVGYRLVRSPMVLALGWLTVFVYGMCLTPVLQDPKNHWDCVAALILHVTLIVVLAIFAPQILLFTLIMLIFEL